MTIATVADIEKLKSRAVSYNFNKSVTAITQGSSGWRSTSLPAVGIAPSTTTAFVVTEATAGAFPIRQAPTGSDNYLVAAPCQTTSTTPGMLLVHDRLMHSGGYTITSTAVQTVAADATQPEYVDRKGASDYSELQWWCELYTAFGTTGISITYNVVYNDGTTDAVVLTGFAFAANKLLPIFPNVAGKYIREITSLQQSASAVTGAHGVTCTRAITEAYNPQYETVPSDWNRTGLPKIPASAALFLIDMGTSAATIRIGSLRIGYG